MRAQQGEHAGRRAFEALAEGVGAPLVAGLVVRRLHREHRVDVGVGVPAAQGLEHRDQLRRLAGQGHAALDALDDLLQLAAGEVGGAGVVDVEAQGGEHLQPRQRVHPRALGRGQGGEQAPDVDRRGEDLADGQARRAQGEDLLDEHRAVLGAAHGTAERREALGQPVGDLEDPQVVGDGGGAGDRGRLGALQADRRQVRLDGLLLVGLEQPLRRAAVGEERREALEHRRGGRGVDAVVDPHLGGPGASVVVEHRVHRAQPVDRTTPQVPGAPGEHRVGDPVRPLRVLAGVLELGERVGHPAADRREVRGRLGRQAPERGHDLARVAAGGVQAPGDGLGEVGDVALRRQLHRGREHLAGAFAAGRGLGGEQGAELGELLGGQRGLDRQVGVGPDDVGEPAVLRAGGEHATGDLGAGAGHAGPEVALHRGLGRALGDQGVQRGVAVRAQAVAALDELGDRAVGLVGVELGAARLETRDARAEPGVAAVGTLGQRDAQVAHLRRQLVAQHPQGLRLLAGHEHAAALGEQRTEQVRDRVGLAGARRPLDDDPRVATQPAEDPALRRADGQREERVDDGRLVVPRAGEPGGAVGGLDRLDELGEADGQGAFRVGQVGDDRVVERAQRRGPAPAGDERGGGHERGAGPGRGDPVVAAGVLDPQVPVRPPGEDGDEVGVQRRRGGDVLAGRGVVDEPGAGQQLLVLPARGVARERHDHLVAVVLDAHRAGEQVDPDVLVGRVQQAAGEDELDGLGLVRRRAHEVEQRVERRPHRALGGGAQDLVAGLARAPDRALVGHVDEGELAHVVTGVADGAGAREGHPSQHLDQALDPVAQGGVVLGTGDIGRSARDPERFLRHGHDLAPSARVLGPPADHNRIPVQVRAREPVLAGNLPEPCRELEGTVRAPRPSNPVTDPRGGRHGNDGGT